MSGNPVITPQQEKASLRAKKVKKRPLKQTLIKPYSENYRPQVTTEEAEKLLNVLSTLPRLVPEKTHVLWSTIKDIPKEKRKEFRSQHQERLPELKGVRQKLAMGINKVTQGLEKNELEAVMLTFDINPFYMAQHVIDLCVLNNTPILIVQNLRKELYDTLGIASTCIGIGVGHNNEVLRSLSSTVREIWLKYPPPEDHALSKTASSIVVKKEEPMKKIIKAKKDKDKQGELFCELHLVRTDNKSRVFMPQRERRDGFNADFIRFKQNNADVDKSYIGMQVSKMLANKNKEIRGIRRNKIDGKFQPNKFKQNKNKK